MSRKGNYWDNAVAESFLKQLNMNGSTDLNSHHTTNYTALYNNTLTGIIPKEFILL